jgi:predicted transposase/invertase (TIGR01784 family)
MYDITCKFLAETFPADFSTWLLGKSILLTKLEPSELSVEPIRADSVIFLESSEIILHIEFQTRTDETMAFRMLDYWVRLYRKYPHKNIHQTVIYLKPTDSALAYQTSFVSTQTNHSFNVIRLWEQPTQTFQLHIGLLPLAVLTKTSNPRETLTEVAKQINNIADRKIKSNIATATAIISGLALEKEIIQRLLRSEIMKESVIYQEILLEGKAEGKALGISEGKAEGLMEGMAKERNQIALNMIHSGISIDLIAQFTGLTLEQIQKLQ